MSSGNQPISQPKSGGRGPWIALLVLSLVGLGLAAKLTDIHVRAYLDPGYRSFCALNAAFSCDAVAQSRWSVVLGAPVSVWGMLAYAAMVLVSIWGLRRGRGAAGAMLLLGSAALLTGGGMAVLSVVKVHAMCPLCLGTYVIDLVTFVLSLAVARRAGLGTSLRELFARPGLLAAVVLPGIVLAIVVGAAYPAYWKKARPTVELTTGVDDSGSHWMGAASPKLTIVEFSDYQCPHCQRGHELVRGLVTAHPSVIRLVHRHFPLDRACNPRISRSFHEQACRDAALAICAGDLGRFWAANDYLFEHSEAAVDVRAMADEIGLDPAALERCMDEKKYQSRLEADVRTGINFDIDGTPTYFLNGKKYPGQIPPEALQPYLSDTGS